MTEQDRILTDAETFRASGATLEYNYTARRLVAISSGGARTELTGDAFDKHMATTQERAREYGVTVEDYLYYLHGV